MCGWVCVYILGMCICITEAYISMDSQQYDTYEAVSDAIRFDSPLLRCKAIRCNTMQWKKYDHFYFFGSDRQQIIN